MKFKVKFYFEPIERTIEANNEDEARIKGAEIINELGQPNCDLIEAKEDAGGKK